MDPVQSKPQSVHNPDIEENKVVAAIGYVWILCLIPLLLKRNSKFVQFHAKQALLLFIVEIVGSIVFWIPIIGWLLWIAVIALAAMGAVKAMQGEQWEMPVIGRYARSLNI